LLFLLYIVVVVVVIVVGGTKPRQNDCWVWSQHELRSFPVSFCSGFWFWPCPLTLAISVHLGVVRFWDRQEVEDISVMNTA